MPLNQRMCWLLKHWLILCLLELWLGNGKCHGQPPHPAATANPGSQLSQRHWHRAEFFVLMVCTHHESAGSWGVTWLLSMCRCPKLCSARAALREEGDSLCQSICEAQCKAMAPAVCKLADPDGPAMELGWASSVAQFGSVTPHRRSVSAELGRTPVRLSPVRLSPQNVPTVPGSCMGTQHGGQLPRRTQGVMSFKWHVCILGLLVGRSQPVCCRLMEVVQEEGANSAQVTACSALFRNPARQRLLTLDQLWGTGGSGNSSHRGSQDNHFPATAAAGSLTWALGYVLLSRTAGFLGVEVSHQLEFWSVQFRVLSSRSFWGGFEPCSAAGSSQALGSQYAKVTHNNPGFYLE